MTLVVCLKSAGGIVLAADSRGTIGDPRGLTAINDSQIKLYQIGRCGMAMAGASEMGAVLLDELHKREIDGVQNIDDALKLVLGNCAQLFAQWFQGIPPTQRPAVLFTLAGYRQINGADVAPMIYLLNSQMNFAPQLFDHAPCMSGVPQYAVYLVHRYYDPSITLERAKALAEYLITETASQDPKVGGPVRMSEITPETGYRQLGGNEIQSISRANEKLNTRLRQFFLQGRVQ